MARIMGSTRRKIALILCGTSAVWFWGLAPLFHYLSITTNDLQFRWTVIIFLWEVPVLGGLFIWHALLKFAPIARALDGETTTDPKALYYRLTTYPASVAFIEFAWGIIGYTLGTLQLRYFADLPFIEGAKNIGNGIGLSLFLGLILYVLLDGHLASVRTTFKKRYDLPQTSVRRVARRILGLTFLTAIGTLLLVGLLTFKSWQGIIQKQLLLRMREDAARALQDIAEAPDEEARGQLLMELAREFRRGERGRIFTLPRDTDAFTELPLSPDVADVVRRGQSTVLLDERGESKIVAVLADTHAGERLVSVVFLSEFYRVLGEPMTFFLFGALLIVTLISIISVFVSYLSTRAFKGFTAAIRKGDAATIASFASGDELEEVAHALVASMNEARDLREKLESRVVEQTTEIERRGNELKDKHQALEEAYAKTEALLNSIGEGVLAIDSGGRIVFMNQMVADFLEKRAEDMIGFSMLDPQTPMPHAEDASGNVLSVKERPIFRALATGRRQMQLVYQVTRGGRRIATHMTATPVLLRGETTGAVAVWRDVTEEQRVEHAKTEFVSIASHQFRTPLSVLRWYTEVLLSHELGDLTAPQQKFITEIHHAARRLSKLVNTLLQITKIELGALPLETGAPTDVALVLNEAIAENDREISVKDLRITRRYESGVPPVRTSAEILSIVCGNLISNAVRYTPAHGSVTVTLAAEKSSGSTRAEAAPPGFITITVADTGYGIPEDEQPFIFSRLFRATNVADKEVEGTGIGLYIVNLVLNRIGGSIRFESKEGVGTTFSVSIPTNGP